MLGVFFVWVVALPQPAHLPIVGLELGVVWVVLGVVWVGLDVAGVGLDVVGVVVGAVWVVLVTVAAVASGTATADKSATATVQPKRTARASSFAVKARVTSTGPSNRSKGHTACCVQKQA